MAKARAGTDDHLVEMRKDGEFLEVHPTAVKAHRDLGWGLVDDGDDSLVSSVVRQAADADAARTVAEQHLAAVDSARKEVADVRAENSELKARLAEAEAEAKRQGEAREKAVADAVKRATSEDDPRLAQAKRERDEAVKMAAELQSKLKAATDELQSAKAKAK